MDGLGERGGGLIYILLYIGNKTIFTYSESKLTFHFVVVVVVLLVVLRRKVEKDGNAKKGPLY